MPCKEICHRYKATKPPISLTRYGTGQKRCTLCDVFMEWDDKQCPCCGRNLRTKPKGTIRRNELMILNKVKRI